MPASVNRPKDPNFKHHRVKNNPTTLGCGFLRSKHSQLRRPYSSSLSRALGQPILECLYLVTSRWHLRLCECRDGCLCMPLVSPVFIVCQSVPAPRRSDHTDANHRMVCLTDQSGCQSSCVRACCGCKPMCIATSVLYARKLLVRCGAVDHTCPE